MTRDIIFVTHHLGGIGGVQRVVDQLATRFAEDGMRRYKRIIMKFFYIRRIFSLKSRGYS